VTKDTPVTDERLETIATLAKGFILAARIPGIALRKLILFTHKNIGSSFSSCGIRLKEGASIQLLRFGLSDIDRDVGLGDRSNEIEVAIDMTPRIARVLLPRPDRQFPSLPRL